MTSVDAGLGADGFGGALVVAGEHDHMNAHVLQFLHGPRAVFLDDVGHGDDPDEDCRPQLKNSGVLPCLGQGFCLAGISSGIRGPGAR